MAETSKVTIARLRRELRAFKQQAERSGAGYARATANHQTAMLQVQRLRDDVEKHALRASRLEGYIDRVREEDARRRGEPVVSVGNVPPVVIGGGRPTPEQILDWYDPPELVDIGLGADEEDLEAGRLGSDSVR